MKWGSVGATLLLLVGWALSFCITTGWYGAVGAIPGKLGIFLLPGGITAEHDIGNGGAGLFPPAWNGWHVTDVSSSSHVSWTIRFGGTGPVDFVAIPFWCPLLLTMGSAASAWRLDRLAARRARQGLCPNCNYDLSGLPPSPGGTPCPECGNGASTPSAS